MLIVLGDYERALTDLDDLAAAAPTVDVLTCRARCFAELGRDERALADSRRAVELDPLDEDANVTRIDILSLLRKADEAIAVLIQWENAHGGAESHDGRKTPRLALCQAEVRTRQGLLGPALAAANAVIGASPTPEALALRAEIRRRAGDAAGALADVEAALAQSSEDPLAHTTRGLVREARGDLAGARADLEGYARKVSRLRAVHDEGLAALERLSKSR